MSIEVQKEREGEQLTLYYYAYCRQINDKKMILFLSLVYKIQGSCNRIFEDGFAIFVSVYTGEIGFGVDSTK